MTKPLIDQLVDRFLACPLPDGVKADPCACNPHHPHRTGTNLLTAVEAKQMLEQVLGLTQDHIAIITNGTLRIIPKDEPVFLLRGQDKYAARAVRFWADLVDMDANGGTPEIAETARAHAKKMAAWEPKKTPDLPR